MNKNQNLKDAYNAIKSGETITCDGYTQIYLDYSHRDRREYIRWYGYGSSCMRVSLKNLRFIMGTICHSEDFSFQYLKTYAVYLSDGSCWHEIAVSSEEAVRRNQSFAKSRECTISKVCLVS